MQLGWGGLRGRGLVVRIVADEHVVWGAGEIGRPIKVACDQQVGEREQASARGEEQAAVQQRKTHPDGTAGRGEPTPAPAPRRPGGEPPAPPPGLSPSPPRRLLPPAPGGGLALPRLG